MPQTGAVDVAACEDVAAPDCCEAKHPSLPKLRLPVWKKPRNVLLVILLEAMHICIKVVELSGYMAEYNAIAPRNSNSLQLPALECQLWNCDVIHSEMPAMSNGVQMMGLDCHRSSANQFLTIANTSPQARMATKTGSTSLKGHYMSNTITPQNLS